MSLGYKFPRAGNECNRNMNWVQGQRINEKKISLNFIFVFKLLRFRHTFHALSEFASQIKLICGGGQLLVTWSQGPITRALGVRIPCSSVTGPKAQGPSSRFSVSQVSGSRVPEPRVSGSQVSGSQDSVLILDYSLCLCVYLL